MIASTPAPSKPFSRSSGAAVSTIRLRLSAACSLLTRISHPSPLLTPLTEYMTHIMNIVKMTNVIYKPKLNRASTYQHEELVMTDLPYRTALIVGAGSGISASVARRLAAAGLSVRLAARNGKKLAAVAAETRAPTFDVAAHSLAPVA